MATKDEASEVLEIYYPDNYNVTKNKTCMKTSKNNNGTLWGKIEIPSQNTSKYKWTFRITNPGGGGGGSARGAKMAIGIGSGFDIMKDTKSVFYERNTSNYHIRIQDGKLFKKGKPIGNMCMDLIETQSSESKSEDDNPANKSASFTPKANDIFTVELDLMHRQIIFVYYRNNPLPIAEGIINGIDINEKLKYKLAIYCGQKNSELELVNFREYVTTHMTDIQDEKESDQMSYNDLKRKYNELQMKMSELDSDQKETQPSGSKPGPPGKLTRIESETTMEFTELFNECQRFEKEAKGLKVKVELLTDKQQKADMDIKALKQVFVYVLYIGMCIA